MYCRTTSLVTLRGSSMDWRSTQFANCEMSLTYAEMVFAEAAVSDVAKSSISQAVAASMISTVPRWCLRTEHLPPATVIHHPTH